MKQLPTIEELNQDLQRLKQSACALRDKGAGIPAVRKNLDRILASIKMLEMQFSDLCNSTGADA